MWMFALLACPPDEGTVPGSPTWTDSDGSTLVVEGDGAIRWTRSDGTVHTLTLGLGTVLTVDEDACSYDPWWLYDERVARGTMASESYLYDVSESCNDATHLDDAVAAEWTGETYTIQFDGGEIASLAVDDLGPGIRLTLRHDDATWAPYATARITTTADEEFYGLGEQFETALLRGTVRAMQIELAATESAYNEAHVPIPLLLSSAGWGMYVDSDRPGVFDVAASSPTAVQATFQQRDGDFALDLYDPGGAGKVTGRYWDRTGLPEVPPDWAFAPLQWRNAVEGEDVILEDAATLRELGLPTGVIWVDNPWQSTYNSMQPDTGAFPNWDAMVDTLSAQGFRFMAWTTPYVEADDPEWQTYADNGWFVEDVPLFSDFGDIVDLTHPGAAAAWAGRVAAARDRGVEGWKLDYGEDVQLGVFGGRVRGWSFADGRDERTMHHRYNEAYHQPYSDPYRGEGMLLGRGGCKGCQSLTDVIWPGDLDNGFELWGDGSCEDGPCVGGLVSAIHGGTSLSVSGYPFFASDTGGYRGGRPSKESFVRWMEYAAVLPIWQYGGAGENHNPWDFSAYEDGKSQFDAELLAAFARYAELHIRLWPYYQAAVATMLADGVPMVLPQGLGDPDGGVHDPHDFFVGDAIFVAPVVEEGAGERDLTLPSGEWLHWWTNDVAGGGDEVSVRAPLGEGPLYQRIPSAIPMLRRSVVTLAPATAEGVDSWADHAGALNARVIPGAGAGFSLATGEALTAGSAAAIAMSDGTLYQGWDLEVYAPGATRASADGQPLSEGEPGCGSCLVRGGGEGSAGSEWIRVILPAGTATLTVE